MRLDILKLNKVYIISIFFLSLLCLIPNLNALPNFSSNSIENNAILYKDKDYCFNTTYYDNENIKQSIVNSSIDFINLNNVSNIIHNDLNISNNYLDSNINDIVVYSQNNESYQPIISKVKNISVYNTNITVNTGNFDNTNNMLINDDINSVFTSTKEYINATWNFDNESLGTSGTDIDFVDFNNFDTCTIYNDVSPYFHYIHFYEGSTTYAVFYNVFSNQESGTIELYTRRLENNKDSVLSVNSGSTKAVLIYFRDNGYISAYYSTTYHDFCTYNPNEWIHIRFDFECGSGSYQGLSADTYFVYVNNVKYGAYPFSTARTTLNWLLVSNNLDAGTSIDIDNVGYSWKSDYYIGLNQEIQKPYLDFNINLNFTELNELDFLELNFTSFHYTNISQYIPFYIYNYNLSSYELMFNTSQVLETKNQFILSSNVSKYISNENNIQLHILNLGNYQFDLLIDFINIKLNYTIENSQEFKLYYQKLNIDLVKQSNILLNQFELRYKTNINIDLTLCFYNYSNNQWINSTLNSIITFKNYTYEYNYFLNGSYFIIIRATSSVPFTLFLEYINFRIYIPTIISFERNFNEVGSYAYRFIIFYYNETILTNYTQEWIYFTVVISPFLYYGIKIPFYIYFILIFIPIILIILFRKWYITNKPRLIKSYIINGLVIGILLLLGFDSISVYLTIGNVQDTSFVFTLLNALVFGVFLNIIGLNGKGIFRKTTIKATTLILLVLLAISGFGFFGLLFVFNFPLNLILTYNIFSTNTVHGIRFFGYNILLFVLITFFSFLTESEVDS